MLSLPRAWVQSLIDELRSHKPLGAAKEEKKKKWMKDLNIEFSKKYTQMARKHLSLGKCKSKLH